ncbi:hypothetical protein Ahy_A03g015302 [Arachis hypogaea]|uniref:Aminotransferase-like plant mobile domain-containing protein n=1 Tax=Arachis hypogaea TaxID=3818 RepID=A0A445E083_ARAHY|nr:hypothetical protein Ahy_A03g015302 [Arachis hypogaea]
MACKLDLSETWNLMVEDALQATEFYHISRIGVTRGFYTLLSILVKRWRLETHNFVLLVGEVTVILKDVPYIFGLPIDRQVVSGWTNSSGEFLQSQCIAIFGHKPVVSSSSKSYIKLAWVRRIRDTEPFGDFGVYLEISEMPNFLFAGFDPICG